MARKYSIYWYEEDQEVYDAFLFNCRDHDLKAGEGIAAGTIILGECGCVVAERPVRGLTGKELKFHPNRRCEWQGHELDCMVHPSTPGSAKTKAALRPYNYLVAELREAAELRTAQDVGLPVITNANGKKLINLECTTFQRQGLGSPRRVGLI